LDIADYARPLDIADYARPLDIADYARPLDIADLLVLWTSLGLGSSFGLRDWSFFFIFCG
jgi:hypothetical protein